MTRYFKMFVAREVGPEPWNLVLPDRAAGHETKRARVAAQEGGKQGDLLKKIHAEAAEAGGRVGRWIFTKEFPPHKRVLLSAESACIGMQTLAFNHADPACWCEMIFPEGDKRPVCGMSLDVDRKWPGLACDEAAEEDARMARLLACEVRKALRARIVAAIGPEQADNLQAACIGNARCSELLAEGLVPPNDCWLLVVIQTASGMKPKKQDENNLQFCSSFRVFAKAAGLCFTRQGVQQMCAALEADLPGLFSPGMLDNASYRNNGLMRSLGCAKPATSFGGERRMLRVVGKGETWFPGTEGMFLDACVINSALYGMPPSIVLDSGGGKSSPAFSPSVSAVSRSSRTGVSMIQRETETRRFAIPALAPDDPEAYAKNLEMLIARMWQARSSPFVPFITGVCAVLLPWVKIKRCWKIEYYGDSWTVLIYTVGLCCIDGEDAGHSSQGLLKFTGGKTKPAALWCGCFSGKCQCKKARQYLFGREESSIFDKAFSRGVG